MPPNPTHSVIKTSDLSSLCRLQATPRLRLLEALKRRGKWKLFTLDHSRLHSTVFQEMTLTGKANGTFSYFMFPAAGENTSVHQECACSISFFFFLLYLYEFLSLFMVVLDRRNLSATVLIVSFHHELQSNLKSTLYLCFVPLGRCELTLFLTVWVRLWWENKGRKGAELMNWRGCFVVKVYILL